ncbi:MAG: Mrp/NBP35 family ATP-binding protein, partial [bacterium]
GVKNVIAVASGKGGVGKSTVAANLAAAFQSEGLRSGLLDLDIYGPSIPTMFGLNERPEIGGKNADKIMPLDYRGLQVMSLGLVINPEEPVIWRGPMVSKAVKQLLRDVVWDDLDCLVIDLPPGTGDTQLSLLQLIPVAGAIIVTTPQEVALSDVRKGTQMFRKMGTSVLGIIENMAGFICPECGHKSEIFGSGGGEREAKRLGVEMLGRIPLKENLRSSGDEGTPLVFSEPESNGAKKFKKISRLVTEKLQAADTD